MSSIGIAGSSATRSSHQLGRLTLLASVLLALLLLAGTVNATAATVTNPTTPSSPSTLTVNGGYLRVGDTIDEGLDAIDPAPVFTGTIDGSGNINIPRESVNFGELEFPVDTDVPVIGNIKGVIGIEILPQKDITGSIDPITGESDLDLWFRIRAYRISGSSLLDLGNGCYLGGAGNSAIHVPLSTSTGPDPASSNSTGGSPYDVATGLARYATQGFSVPGQSGCSGLAAGQINGLLGIPSSNTGAEFEIEFDPRPISTVTINLTGKPANPTNQTNANFAFTTDAPGMTLQCSLDGGSWSDCSGGTASWSGLNDGPHTFQVRAVASGAEVGATSYSWAIDTVKPILDLDGIPADLSNSRTVTFLPGSDKPLATASCKLDGIPKTPCEPGTPLELTGIPDGEHTFTFSGADSVGNQADPISVTWTVDGTAPVVSFDAGSTPPPVASAVEWTFEFTATDNRALADPATECRIWERDDPAKAEPDPDVLYQGQDWAECESPDEVVLDNGFWRYEVRARDEAGNLSNLISAQWEINSNQPTLLTLVGPAGSYWDNAGAVNANPALGATFTFTPMSGAPIYECTLNGQPAGNVPGDPDPARCESPVTVPGPQLGPEGTVNTFTVRPIFDVAPPVPGPVYSYTWVFDRTPPTLTLTQSPQQPNSPTRVATFRYTADGTGSSVTVLCNLDEQGWQPCANSSWHQVTLGDGPHNMKLRARDRAGNLGSVIDWNWLIDTVYPTALIATPPAEFSANRDPLVGFSASDNRSGLTTECRLDNNAWTACNPAAGFQLNSLADGLHNFGLRATDLAGNRVVRQYSWTVDTVNPTVTLAGGPNPRTRKRSAVFQVNAFDSLSGLAGLSCTVDTVTAPCSTDGAGRITFNGPFGEGRHDFQVTATDRAGNQATDSWSWRVDLSEPKVTFSQVPANGSGISATVAFQSDTDNSSFECRLDGASWYPCESPVELTSLAVGQHSFSVRATAYIADENVTGPAASTTWQVEGPEHPGGGGDRREPCPEGQLGNQPNCITPLDPIGGPTNVAGAYNPATGKLTIRLKCPARFKPKCARAVLSAVTGQGRNAKRMSTRAVVKNIKGGKAKQATLQIRPAFRSQVEAMTAVNAKRLFVRVKATGKVLRKMRRKGKVRQVRRQVTQQFHHKYKVRLQG